jgi:hypothetical protein
MGSIIQAYIVDTVENQGQIDQNINLDMNHNMGMGMPSNMDMSNLDLDINKMDLHHIDSYDHIDPNMANIDPNMANINAHIKANIDPHTHIDSNNENAFTIPDLDLIPFSLSPNNPSHSTPSSSPKSSIRLRFLLGLRDDPFPPFLARLILQSLSLSPHSHMKRKSLILSVFIPKSLTKTTKTAKNFQDFDVGLSLSMAKETMKNLEIIKNW